MSELKPCPFCGSKTAVEIMLLSECEMIDEGSPEYNWAASHFIAVCSRLTGGCGANILGGETWESAADAWNRRAE